jgi:para-nitrobenzyl esterase
VSTDKGKIQGKSAEGVGQFLGIPYAAPPVGALRWAAPQPVAPWRGIRSAQSYGNRCPQLASGNGPRSDTEDCLYLNVFSPPGAPAAQGGGRAGAGRLPVLVMIHGGGLVNGSGDQHDGSLIVPARGLFSAAIMESGSCASRTPADAQSAGLAFAAQAGCGNAATAAACLRSQPESALLDASAGVSSQEFTSGGPELPVPPAQAVASGRYTHVPILMGDNHDEGRTFAQGLAGLTEQQYAGLVAQDYGARAPEVLQHYPFSSYPSPYTAAYAIGAVWTDSGFLTGIGGCPAQKLAAQFARGTPAYVYQFDDRHAPGLNHNLPGYRWGAGHAMELAYLWPSFNNGFSLYDLLTPAQLELSHQMVVWWGAFARYHAPVAPGQPAWPPYTSRRLMSLRPGGGSQTISAGTYAAEHQCAFWNAG